MEFGKLTKIHWKEIKEDTIIRYPEVKDLCYYAYPRHPKGCPNVEKCYNAPDFDTIIDFGEQYECYYLLWIDFNFKEYKKLRREEHPEWSERQIRSVLYWQNSIKKLLKNKIESIAKRNEISYVFGCGSGFSLSFQKIIYSMESTGINVFSTLKLNKINFELKPKDKIILCCLLCSNSEIDFKEYKPVNVLDYLSGNYLNKEVSGKNG